MVKGESTEKSGMVKEMCRTENGTDWYCRNFAKQFKIQMKILERVIPYSFFPYPGLVNV